jgi:hypothetical protein
MLKPTECRIIQTLLTQSRNVVNDRSVKRHECLKEIADLVGNALVVVCVGGTSSEWMPIIRAMAI